jgi:hypothetical protein
MSGLCLSPGFFWDIGKESFLTSDREELAPSLRQEIGPVPVIRGYSLHCPACGFLVGPAFSFW